MAHIAADRVKETSTTTGTGNMTLAGAVTQFKAFSAVCSNGDTFYYVIEGQTGPEWESGFGTYVSATPAIARTRVLASSNSGSAVSFSAGTKNIFITAIANNIPFTQEVFNTRDYGAVANAGYAGYSGTGTAGSPAFTVDPANGNFTSAHIGVSIYIEGAGVASGRLTTTISAVTNAYTITLATNIVTSVTFAQAQWGTDDTTAIQAAINAANAVNGGIVVLDSGLTNRSLISNLTMYSNIRLEGTTQSSKLGGCQLISHIVNRNTSNALLDFSGTNTAGTIVHLRYSQLRNVLLHNYDMAGNIIRAFYTDCCNFENVYLLGATGGGYGFHGVEFQDNRLFNCRFEYCGDSTHAAVLLQNKFSNTSTAMGYSDGSCNQNVFYGCIWESSAATCLQLDSTSNSATTELDHTVMDNCKLETDQFRNPMIVTDTNVTYLQAKNTYIAVLSWAGGYTTPTDLVSLGGRQNVIDTISLYQAAAICRTGIRFTTTAGAGNRITGVYANWNTYAVSQNCTVQVDTGGSALFSLQFGAIYPTDGIPEIDDGSGVGIQVDYATPGRIWALSAGIITY